MRRVVTVAGELLLTLGVLTLSFVAWMLWGQDRTVDDRHDTTVTRLEDQFAAAEAPARAGAFAVPRPRRGSPFAVITIPRLDDRPRPVLEGVDLVQLDEGVGHLPGSALPGGVGNFATAGHRVTHGKPYRHIDRLQKGDAIVVETQPGWAVYRYVRYRVVLPDETDVFAPVPDRRGDRPTGAWMTMVACHPPFSARERYVGYARLDRVVPRRDGPPPELSAGR